MVVLALAATAGRGSADFITNTPAWNGSDSIAAFGEPNTATYGQTITVGTDHFLNSFSFNLASFRGAKVDFQAYVYAWDGSKASGPALYTSAANSLAAGSNSYVNFSYNTGGINLTTGSQYVLFLNASNQFDGFSGDAKFGFTYSSTYNGGDFYYLNNGPTFSQVTSTDWSKVSDGDLAFTASLSPTGSGIPTPLPPTLLAGFLGMAMLAGVRRLRRA